MATQVREQPRRPAVLAELPLAPWPPEPAGWWRGVHSDEAPRKESRGEPLRDPWATLCRRNYRPWAQVVLLGKYLLEAAHFLGWDEGLGKSLSPLTY